MVPRSCAFLHQHTIRSSVDLVGSPIACPAQPSLDQHNDARCDRGSLVQIMSSDQYGSLSLSCDSKDEIAEVPPCQCIEATCRLIQQQNPRETK